MPLLTLYSATAPSTLVHHCFTNCIPSTSCSTVPCIHWYSAYSQEKTIPTTYVSSATFKTYPDSRTFIYNHRQYSKTTRLPQTTQPLPFSQGCPSRGVSSTIHNHLAQDSNVWTTDLDLLHRKRRHYQTGSMISCIVPSTTRCLVQRLTRHWRRHQRSSHNHIYRLHHRALG